MTQDEAFKAWWYIEGSQPPFKHHDCDEHTMRMCEIAWANGAFKEREACAKLVDHILKEGGGTWGDAIRARGEQEPVGDDIAAIIACRDMLDAQPVPPKETT